MRALLFTSLALVACNKENPEFCKAHPGEDGCPGMRIDGGPNGPDADVDADPMIDARLCYGNDEYEVCLNAGATGNVVINTGPLDTDSSTLCLTTPPMKFGTTQPAACFVVGGTLTIPDLQVTGSRPLVFLAATIISVTGDIDVASHRQTNGNKTGPGLGTAVPAACSSFAGNPGSNTNGGGGGAGGSFTTKGGNGGTGNNTNSAKGLAADQDATAPTILRPGCPGQNGGNGNGGNGGLGGKGGGAVFLLSGSKIAFGDGSSINASGAGAEKAGRAAGGGGGGTGGMIVLDAPSITIGTNVILLANGGGGSSGGNDTGGCGCNPGGEASLADPTGTILGGTGGGGPGGVGFGGGSPATDGTANTVSGGGGGGGAGYIQTTQDLTGATVSPTAIKIP